MVHRLELAAVDRHRVAIEQMQVAAECDEAGADLAYGWAVVATEIGDRLEVRCKAARQPHQLEIAPALAFEPARGLDLIELAVHVDLEQRRRMIAGATRRLGRNTIKAELGQIERIDKGIDHPHRIIDVDLVVQSLGKQRRLPPIGPLDEPRHPIPRMRSPDS